MEELYKEYLNIVHPDLVFDTKELVSSLEKLPNYIVIPIYFRGEQVGFLDGYELTKDTFRLLNIYRGGASAIAVFRAFEEFEKFVIDSGYSGWYSSVRADTQELVKRLGAKEIQWEQE